MWFAPVSWGIFGQVCSPKDSVFSITRRGSLPGVSTECNLHNPKYPSAPYGNI